MIYCEFPPRKRPLAIVGQEVITVDNLEKSEDGKSFYKAVVSFFSQETKTSDSLPSMLTLEDNCHEPGTDRGEPNQIVFAIYQ